MRRVGGALNMCEYIVGWRAVGDARARACVSRRAGRSGGGGERLHPYSERVSKIRSTRNHVLKFDVRQPLVAV